MYGTGRGLRAKKPGLPATLRAVLQIHAMPNLPCMGLASGLKFQPPGQIRPRPAACPNPPLRRPPVSASGGAPARPPCPCLRPGRSRLSRRSRPQMVLTGRPAAPHTLPQACCRPYHGRLQRILGSAGGGVERPRLYASFSPAGDTPGGCSPPRPAAIDHLMGVWGMWGIYIFWSSHTFRVFITGTIHILPGMPFVNMVDGRQKLLKSKRGN